MLRLPTCGPAAALRGVKRRWTTASARPSPRLIGLFGDMHFQDKGLSQIERTAQWIIDELSARKVDAAICLGDVLNTRDTVSVQAQSAAIQFFASLRETLPRHVPLHVILGNHDMALKHSRRISSLDGLALSARMSQNSLFVHREITVSTVADRPAVFIPYHHDQNEIIAFVEKYKAENSPEVVASTLVFGHLAVGGAFHNINGSQYRGALSPKHFSEFKKTFTGHFHVHQQLGAEQQVMYVGSPMQFNFGDSGQRRGLVLYDAETSRYEHIQNPYGNLYVILNENQLLEANGDVKSSFAKEAVAGKNVRVQYGSYVSNERISDLRQKLLEFGAVTVDHQMIYKRLGKTDTSAVPGTIPETDSSSSTPLSLEAIVDDYVATVRQNLQEAVESRKKRRRSSKSDVGVIVESPQLEEDPSWLSTLVSKEYTDLLVERGKNLVGEVNRQQGSISLKPISFNADITQIQIENFMSVNGSIALNFQEMHDGLWLIEGPNGSGKSTLFEAISWAHFGKFLRNDMSSNDCVNINEKSCRVRIEYKSGFVIDRSRKRGSADQLQLFQRDGSELKYLDDLERGELKHSQARLEQILGIDYETFTKTVILSASTVHGFLSGSPMQRRGLIEGLMGLSHLDLYFEKAQADRQSLEREFSLKIDMKRQKESSKLQLEESSTALSSADVIASTISDLKEQLRSLSESREADMKQYSVKIQSLKSEKEVLLARVDAESKNSDKEVALKRQLDLLGALLQKLTLVAKHRHEISHNQTLCPTCNQILPNDWSISQSEISNTLKSISAELDEAMIDAHSIEQQIQIGSAFEKKLNEDLKLIRSAQLRLNLEIAEKDVETANLEAASSKRESAFLLAKSALDGKISESETLLTIRADKLSDIQSNISKLLSEIDVLNSDLTVLNEKLNVAKFWENAFEKRVRATKSGFVTFRSFVFGNAVRSINEVLEVYASQLASDYQGGDISALDTTLDENLELKENYGRRSSGERKRTDLALLLALFDIARQRSGYQSKYLLLDEVFDALDQSGRVAVQSVLSTLAEKVPKIFLISHSDIAVGASLAGTIRTEMARDNRQRPLGTKLKIEEY